MWGPFAEQEAAAAPASGLPPAVLDKLRRVARDPARPWTTRESANTPPLGSPHLPSGYRAERARDLLTTTALSVTEIALETGFSSSQHLSTAFRRLTGSTPTDYRRRQS